MTHTYNITGMTCNGCVTKVKSELLKLGDITSADIQLNAPQATISMQRHISTAQLQAAINKAGKFNITDANHHMAHTVESGEEKSWLQTYKPILLIAAYLLFISLLTQAHTGFNLTDWMNNFMAGFFLTFSFFKLLDLKGFAESYSSYDVIAKKWMGWGYVYAFIELILGVSFLLRFQPLLVNGATFVIMSVSIIGVLQSVLHKRKIQCACLGAVFNLPMSTITIIEDGLMIAMSGSMIQMSI